MQKKNYINLNEDQKSYHCCFYGGAVHAGEEGQGTLPDKREHKFQLGRTMLTGQYQEC